MTIKHFPCISYGGRGDINYVDVYTSVRDIVYIDWLIAVGVADRILCYYCLQQTENGLIETAINPIPTEVLYEL